jgi:ubiquinone/menaquinone biosynthesis C-methylase UbiE
MTDYLDSARELTSAEVAEVFNELSFWAARFGILLFDHLELRPNLAILDIGCATGFPLFELANVHGPSCRVTGIDVWQEALVQAARKRRIYEWRNVQLVAGDGALLPFAPASFDLIVSGLGINNFAQPATVLAECLRVAKPGARLVLTTNLNGHMREFYDLFRLTLQEFGRPVYLERLQANEAHRGTVASVTALLEAAGFRVVRAIEDRFQLRYLDGQALFTHSLTRLGFLDSWRQVVDPADERAIFGALAQKLNAVAAQQGGLRLTVPMLYIEGTAP